MFVAIQDEVCKPFKACKTPGCTLHDFHNGAHSNEIVSKDKRAKRRAHEEGANIETSAVLDCRGLSGYGGLCKTGHREVFVQAALETDGTVAYLEGPDGALTSLLRERGIARHRLAPYNLSSKVCESIEKRFDGIHCICRDICEAAFEAELEEFSVIWFDMCAVDFGSFLIRNLVDCAQFKLWTVSSRQVLCFDQQTALCTHLTDAGEKIVEKSLYTGCSEKAMNMVFVVSKRSCRKRARSKSDSSDDSSLDCDSSIINIGTIVRVPLSFWPCTKFVHIYGFKIFKFEGVDFLVGSVKSPASNTTLNYRLTFQLENGGTRLCAHKYSRAFIMAHAL